MIRKEKLLRMVFVAVTLPAAFVLVLTQIRNAQMNLPGPGPYICQTFNGRLANHIWQYASIYGIATLNNFSIILGKDDDIVRYFEVPSATIMPDRRVCETFLSQNAKHCCFFEPHMTKLDKSQNYKLGEYLQSWKYFRHVQDKVRTELTLKRPIKSTAKEIIENYRSAYQYKHGARPVVVGVHVRIGDIAADYSIKAGLILPSYKYFYRGFKIFLDKYKHVVFIVCTDTPGFVRKLISGRNETIHFIQGTPIQDFALLSSADHVLTSVGSYGWWAGYLSGGTVVYFATPTSEGSQARTEYNYDDYFPPHWIPLT